MYACARIGIFSMQIVRFAMKDADKFGTKYGKLAFVTSIVAVGSATCIHGDKELAGLHTGKVVYEAYHTVIPTN